VRVGDGVMVVGLSGIRADVIPWAILRGPKANLVGLNVIGLRRNGFSKADIGRYDQAYQALFFGPGLFQERVEQVAEKSADSALIASMIAFIRAGKRPLTMAARNNENAESDD